VSETKYIPVDINDLPKKFAVFQTNSHHGEQIQNWLFKTLNAKWAGDSGQKVQHAEKDVLYVERSDVRGWFICYSSIKHFNEKEKNNYVLIDFKPVTMFEIAKVVELVEINGKKYELASLIDAIHKTETIAYE
jgi:hypothetical protein